MFLSLIRCIQDFALTKVSIINSFLTPANKIFLNNIQVFPSIFKSLLCVVLVARSCPTLCNPMEVLCSPPWSSVHGILQARILEWGAISFSRVSSRPRDQTCVSWIGAGGFFTTQRGRMAQYDLKSLFKVVLTPVKIILI